MMNDSVLTRLWQEMASCFQLAMTTLEVAIITEETELLPLAQDALAEGWSTFTAAIGEVRQVVNIDQGT